jgi:hypothetical protein
LQVRRGTAAEVAAITPLEGEPVWATDTKLLYLGDGSTAGGIQVGEFPLEGDLASGTTAGKIRAADATNPSNSVAGNARGAGSVELQMSRSSSTAIASGLFSVIAGGANSRATGEYCTVMGGQAAQAGPGSYALAFGNNAIASGDNSIAFNGTATGAGGFAVGVSASASSLNSIALGANSSAGAERAIAIGNAVAFGANGIGLGNNAAAVGAMSVAMQNATADRQNMVAVGAETITNFTGRGQAVQFQMRGRTTDDTPTEMLLADSVKLTIPANVALFGTIEIAAIQVTTAAESAHYVRKFAIQRLGSTTTLIGSVTTVGTDYESSAGMDVAITADDTGDFLKVEVTGLAATTLRWMACVRGVEMAIT